MTRTLVPLDGSDPSIEALRYALEHFGDGTIVCLTVIDPVEAGYTTQVNVPGYSQEWFQEAQDSAEHLFEEAHAIAEPYGTDVETATEVGRPSRTIVEFSEEHDIDNVVMGSHGREGVSRILVGSVAETVMRRSSVPVTIVR